MFETTYSVTTPFFEGPLDLLLSLIERAELDITRLSLAKVTDQYIEHIQHLQYIQAEDVSSFLVIAARLLQIKSEVLLPKPPEIETMNEDIGNDLAYQLLVYKKFKKTGEYLSDRERAGLHSYRRISSLPHLVPKYDLNGYQISDIVEAAKDVFSRKPSLQPVESVVAEIKVTIREKISMITRLINRKKASTFRELLSGEINTRIDVVITFLAMLELVKRHLISARQGVLFGEIEVEMEGDWDSEMVFDVEFD